MTQRIFDVENEKDMEDLWDILPDGIIKISSNNLAQETSLWSELNLFTLPIGLIKINWHDKTEIIRPIQEATEADVGNLGYKIKNQRHEIELQIAQNAQLKEQIKHLQKTQARQFVDNQKLQTKAEKAKDVVNIETARQINQLKELLKECQNMIAFKHKVYEEDALIKEIDEVLR